MSDFGKPAPTTALPKFSNTKYEQADEEVGDFDSRTQAAKPAKGTGARREYFEEWKPNQDLVPVIFHEGSYINTLLEKDSQGHSQVRERKLPFKRIVEHFNKNATKGTPKSAVCSAVPFHEERGECDRLCSGCKTFSKGFAKVDGKWKQTGAVSKQEKRAFSIGRAQAMVAEDSQARDKNGNPYKNWVPENRQNPDHKGREKVMGRRYVYGATMSQYYQIMGGIPGVAPGTSIKDKVARNCAGCGSIDSIRLVQLVCSDPSCEYPIEEAAEDATDAELASMAEKRRTKVKCPGCSAVVTPVKKFTCSNVNCKEPRSARIFDGICWLRGVPSKVSDGGPVSYAVTLEKWTPLPANHPWKDIMQPIDLDTVKAPAPPEMQERIFGFRPEAAPAPELTPGSDPYDDGGSSGHEPAKGSDDVPFLGVP